MHFEIITISLEATKIISVPLIIKKHSHCAHDRTFDTLHPRFDCVQGVEADVDRCARDATTHQRHPEGYLITCILIVSHDPKSAHAPFILPFLLHSLCLRSKIEANKRPKNTYLTLV